MTCWLPSKGGPLWSYDRQFSPDNEGDGFTQAITIRKELINEEHLKEKEGSLGFFRSG